MNEQEILLNGITHNNMKVFSKQVNGNMLILSSVPIENDMGIIRNCKIGDGVLFNDKYCIITHVGEPFDFKGTIELDNYCERIVISNNIIYPILAQTLPEYKDIPIWDGSWEDVAELYIKCPSCGGDGWIPDYDEEGDIIQVSCDNCMAIGYKHHQATHPFSQKDMENFCEWKDRLTTFKNKDCYDYYKSTDSYVIKELSELIKMWTSQRTQTMNIEFEVKGNQFIITKSERV